MRKAIVFWGPVALLAGAIALSSPQRACAQQLSASDEEARALFEAGRVAYANGRYDKALAHFQAAYDLSKRPPLLYNIANTLDRLRRDEEALRNFEEFVRLDPNSQYVPAARERITFLREALAARQRGAAPPPEPLPSPEPVPTPAETAQAAPQQPEPPSAAPTGATATDEPEGGGSIAGKWWFWTAIGVVAAGTVVGIAVASGGGSESVQAPLDFDGNTRDVRL
jgi:tetratricopeptide (TPR) repeat protein